MTFNYFGFVYIWYDKKWKKFYIGSHHGQLDDGYIGSNKHLKNAFKKRPNDFKRRILYFLSVDDHASLLLEEQRWLDMIKFDELGIRYYNLKKAATGLDSQTIRNIQNKLVENGTHHLLGGKLQRKAVEDGKNVLVGGKLQRKMLEDGTHILCDPIHRERLNKRNKELVTNGSHNFLSEEHKIRSSLMRKQELSEGKHNFTYEMRSKTTQKEYECPICQRKGKGNRFKGSHFNKCKEVVPK